jgi:hypothetical protein
MPRRSLLVLLAALAGIAAVVLRRRERLRDRVTVGFEDGSSLTLEAGNPDADRLLALARPTIPS